MGGGGGGPKVPALVIEFDAKPAGSEEKLHTIVKENVLDRTSELLDMIHKYGGCEDVIRKALNEPGPAEVTAWENVSAAVEKLYEFYMFSQSLDKTWPQIVAQICVADATQGVTDNLRVVSQVARIFSFVFHFDESKMLNPAIQNDFSYYRRVLGRMKDKTKKDEGRRRIS